MILFLNFIFFLILYNLCSLEGLSLKCCKEKKLAKAENHDSQHCSCWILLLIFTFKEVIVGEVGRHDDIKLHWIVNLDHGIGIWWGIRGWKSSTSKINSILSIRSEVWVYKSMVITWVWIVFSTKWKLDNHLA